MGKVKFGVIGLGRIANDFCGDLIQSEKAELYAVASRSIEKAEEFKQKYNAKKSYGSYIELSRDKDIDIVYVATPHVSHKDISIMCMNEGKAVLCEKPAGVNESELQEMIECAKKNNVLFMEGMWTRFFPISQKIKEIVRTKELGEVRHIEADFGFGSWQDDRIYNDNHRLFSPHLAGGAILDVGIYPVAYTTWLKESAPDRISSFAHKTPHGVDGSTVMMFSYDDNCTAQLQCSVCLDTSSDAKIYFDNGKIEVKQFYRPKYMKMKYPDGSIEEIIDDYDKCGFHGFIYEIDHVAECINKGLKMSPYHTWNDALEVIRILDTVRRQIDLKYPFE